MARSSWMAPGSASAPSPDALRRTARILQVAGLYTIVVGVAVAWWLGQKGLPQAGLVGLVVAGSGVLDLVLAGVFRRRADRVAPDTRLGRRGTPTG